METKTQHGYLVLADISGYTSYLAGTELEHAQEILTELLETIVDHFKSMLTISKLEGDAVFGYVADAKAPRGETLLELIEGTYVAFRDRVEAVRRFLLEQGVEMPRVHWAGFGPLSARETPAKQRRVTVKLMLYSD